MPHRPHHALPLLCLTLLLSTACRPAYLAYREEGEALSGGQATVFDTSPNAFSFPLETLERTEKLHFFVGNSFFNQNWVTAPASTTARDGLGPFFNARSCASCHFKDGRGRPPEQTHEPSTGFLLRLGLLTPSGTLQPEPTYGHQLQDNAIMGLTAEGQFTITYEEIPGTFADGTPYSLRRPTYTFANLAAGNMAAGVLISPRVAPQMIGLGLLEAVPEATLRGLADPDDANGDGISGRVNEINGAAGRFGWKANQPTLWAQTAAAFLGDMGITTSLHPTDLCETAACTTLPNGGSPEISDEDLAKVVLYVSSLAVPGRRAWDTPEVLRGKGLFMQANCHLCHIPSLETGEHPLAALSHQRIFPYTDLLLHDMGPGLADGRPDFLATGSEWRTPPLWGIGLIETVNDHTYFLHDGRARTLTEAILWHGGEAEASMEAFRQMTAAERKDLIRFLESQ